MTTPARIAVTGATGQLGGRIARRLAETGVAQHLVVRDPTRAPELPGATVAQATFDDAAATRTALTDTPTVLMVSASEDPNRTAQHRTFVDAAVDAGVQHLVYISFYGAAPGAAFTHARDHWATEQHIRSTGIGFTFLRDNMYADFMPALVGEDGAIRGPAGDGRISPVAYDDIADAATAVLLDPGAHNGRTYDLTGPQALTLHEVAAVLAQTLDKPSATNPRPRAGVRLTRAPRRPRLARRGMGVHLHRDRRRRACRRHQRRRTSDRPTGPDAEGGADLARVTARRPDGSTQSGPAWPQPMAPPAARCTRYGRAEWRTNCAHPPRWKHMPRLLQPGRSRVKPGRSERPDDRFCSAPMPYPCW